MQGVGPRIGAWLGLPLAAPDGVSLPDNETLGAIAVDLAWRWPSWVNRRVETIEFVEDTTVRRSMSVDFTFPEAEDLAAPISQGAMIFVPLQILAKETLMHVDVIDEHRASLSTLNTAGNADLSARGLIRLLDAFHRTEHGTPLPAEVAADLRFLASAGPEAARERFKELFARGTSLAKLLDYTVDDPDLEGRAQARPELQMINDLALGFLQLVQVTYQPGLHRVLKVAYDVPQAWSDPTANRWWERGLRAVAALPRRQTFSNVNLGQGMGYHVEVIAPEDTELVEAKLTGGQWSTRESKECPLNLVVLCYVCHSGWVSWRSGSRLRSTGCWQV